MSESLWPRLERVLPKVQSPSAYLGNEFNAIRKEWTPDRFKVGLGFPDAYTIAMSHLGLQIFYGMLNAREDVLAERIFAPWPDLERILRERGIPLFSLENHRPARDFDLIGFSLQTELEYTNILNLLDLAGIPLRAKDRTTDDPFIIGGGPIAHYPEPIAEYFDAFILGDGEDALMQVVDFLKAIPRRERGGREGILRELAGRVPGFYAPSLYDVEYHDDGRIAAVVPRDGAPSRVAKAIVPSLEDAYYPLRPIVPNTEVVHERINLEIMRGCPHKCRFCQAVNLKNKLRLRPVEQLLRFAEETYKATGWDEISLTSLSSGDYPHIQELMTRLNARFKDRRVGVALPSLRIDAKLKELPRLMKTVRKAGFTMAPEAGTFRLRQIIRKPIKDEDLLETAKAAFSEGWRHVKLYFMCGLPGETDDDLRGILQLARQVSNVRREVSNRPGQVNMTISPFIPKPHTAFQFNGMKTDEEIRRRQELLRREARNPNLRLKCHDPRRSFVEAVFARGDRRLAPVVERAWRNGCRFDAWDEWYRHDHWLKTFGESGIDAGFYAHRDIPADEVLSWSHLGSHMPDDFFVREQDEAMAAAAT